MTPFHILEEMTNAEKACLEGYLAELALSEDGHDILPDLVDLIQRVLDRET